MSSNNNLLLLIIAGVIALIVLHITTSNQNCALPEKKSKKKIVTPESSSAAQSAAAASVVTGKDASFKNEKKLDANFNAAVSQSQPDSSASAPVTTDSSKTTLPTPAAPANVASAGSAGSAGSAKSVSSSSTASSGTESNASSNVASPAPKMQAASVPKTREKFSENFSYTEQSQVTEGFNNNNAMENFSESMQSMQSNMYEGFSANDAKSIQSAGEKKPKPDFVIKSASLGNKFGGGNFNVKLTGNSGAVGPNTTNVNGLGVVEGAPDYTLGVTPIISKEKKAKKLTAKDLLPKATKDDWFDMPYDNKQMMRIENENLIAGTATQARIGIDTQGQTLKNASHDLRAAPPNPKFNVGPWFISTIEPDYNIKPIM